MRYFPPLLAAACAPPPPIAEDAEVAILAEGFQFTEGPAVAPNGDVYFTDQPSDRILRFDGEEVHTFMHPSGRSNGLYFDGRGRLLTCADEEGQILAIFVPGGDFDIEWQGHDGKQLNGPNDLWVDADGGIWFTDPYYQRPWWTRTQPDQIAQRVYYISPDHELFIAAEGFTRPNGIIGDGEHLYVADIGAQRTYAYEILGRGELGEPRLVIEQGSDGMTIDAEGRLYLTGKGVTIVDAASGEVVARVAQDHRTSNVTFRGSTLIITARDKLLGLETNTRGIH